MWLNVRNGTTDLPGQGLDAGEIVVGRDAGCDLVVTDERASRRHTRLSAQPDGRIRVEDLGSTNGTWVDGDRITEAVTVGVGSEIRIGRHHLRLTALPQPSGPATVIGDEAARDAPLDAGASPIGSAATTSSPVTGRAAAALRRAVRRAAAPEHRAAGSQPLRAAGRPTPEAARA
jgi:predicted component of type VI protein secretion system